VSIYKACDIRGRFGGELTLQHAARLGAAIGALQGPATVLVGGDGRVSTPALKDALVRALLAAGCQVVDLGMVSTPLFYFSRQKLGIETGVMVTASHNPAGDNGFKVTLGPLPITEEEMAGLAGRIERGNFSPAGAPGQYSQADLAPDYLASVCRFAPDLSVMRVVLDCANGMAGLFARRVWAQTRARLDFLLEDVQGDFPSHPPNPAEAKNLAMLQRAVVAARADLGVAYDGDGDRVAFVDETGQPLVQDKAIVLLARDALRDGPETIVYDQKCSRIVADAIRALGGRPLMELSGHTYIKRAFLLEEAAYAGELSGHHFLRAVGGDDALVSSLFVARILRESGLPLSRLAAEIPAYPITPDLRVPMPPDAIERVLAQLQAALQGEAALSYTDGLRIEFADGWGLVRRSVTEPVLTMRFEGQDQDALERVMERVIGCSEVLRERSAFRPSL
jgi:phosphomannomutase/phosphoglucomutase